MMSRSVIGLPNADGSLKSRYVLTSVSRSSLPCSTCCMTAVHVNSFEIDPGRNRVLSATTGRLWATSAYPYPLANNILPSLTTATTAPAMFRRPIWSGMKPSRKVSRSASVSGTAVFSPGTGAGPGAGILGVAVFGVGACASSEPAARSPIMLQRKTIGTVLGEGRPCAPERRGPISAFMYTRCIRFVAMASFFAAACAKPTADATADASYDVVIGGGHVVDGTGNPWFAGDVAIRGDRIVRVAPSGALANASAKRRIDATGLVVAPGFIDIQGQSDSAFLLGDGRNVSKVTQGITTEILGEGATPAPSNARTLALDSTSDTTMARVDTAWRGTHGFGNWLDAMGHHGISENVGSFVGAATIRMYGKGADTGAPNPAQLDTMRAAVHRAMVDGAFGMASALIYPPGGYAGTDELIAEAKEMAPFHGVYITHMRSEGDHIIDAVSEAFRIGKEGGVPVEI